jgi:putative ABC transport system permease protein
MARKFFGSKEAMGQSILMTDDDRNSELCRVTGVFKDIAENSHLKFNILISYPTLYKRGIDRFEHNWDRKDFYTYIQLRPGTDPNTVSAKLGNFIHQHIPDEAARHAESRLSLQPLSQIHTSTGRLDEPEPTVHGKAIGFLMIIGFFIITIAWVNYINLATVGSVNRAREIGVRKVLGSQRGDLIRLFLIESFSLNLISFGIAMILVYFSRPFLYSLFGIHFQLTIMFSNTYGIVFLAFLIAGAFLSGLYPAFVLSGFKPVAVLKGKVQASAGLLLRQSLVVFQFALSILLIIGTFVVYQQVHFMLNQDLGIKTSQVMVLDRPGRWDTARSTHSLLVQRFKDALKDDPAIESVAMCDEKPGKEIRWPAMFALKGAAGASGSGSGTGPAAASVPINTTLIDEDYIPTLGMNMLAGRNFSRSFKTDVRGLILTASAVRLLGFGDVHEIIGRSFRSDDGDYTVLGVVNDFHQLGLQTAETPSAFEFGGRDLREYEYYLIKLRASGIGFAVERVQTAWTANFANNPFEFSFLDESFNRQYQYEIQFGSIFGIFALLAIAIASIGLFALVAFVIKQRTKEIGVRKVLGASLSDVLVLLSKDFLRLILIANVIAWPVGWLLMNSWLKDFAYRISMNWLVFVFSGGIALIIAMATISIQAVKAALANPIKSLRTE